MKLKKLVVTLSLLGATAMASTAYAVPTITNTDGVLQPFGGFDWNSGAAAWTQGFVPVVGQSFTLFYAATAGAIKDTGGVDIDVSNLDTSANGLKKAGNSYEYTILASLTEEVVSVDFGTGTATFKVTGGMFDIYYDLAANAKQSTGTGYLDGTKVISGNVFASSSAQLFNNATGGQANLSGRVTYTNQTYIDPILVGTNLTSTLQLGGAVTGFTFPSGFDSDNNGTTNPFVGQPIIFQADANQAFSTVPEPGSLALIGGVLGLMGVVGRRRESQVA